MKNRYSNIPTGLFGDDPQEENREVDAEFEADDDPNGVPPNLDELCRTHVCPVCPSQLEAEDLRLRTLAEMDNFKRRLQREKDEHDKYAGENILADLLPSIDSLDLAIQYANPERDASMLQGVVMTRKLMLDALEKHGLTPIGEVGEAYSHELHEAVGEEQRDDMPEMHISTLLQRGYRFKERLLRPAKVMVSRSGA